MISIVICINVQSNPLNNWCLVGRFEYFPSNLLLLANFRSQEYVVPPLKTIPTDVLRFLLWKSLEDVISGSPRIDATTFPKVISPHPQYRHGG